MFLGISFFLSSHRNSILTALLTALFLKMYPHAGDNIVILRLSERSCIRLVVAIHFIAGGKRNEVLLLRLIGVAYLLLHFEPILTIRVFAVGIWALIAPYITSIITGLLEAGQTLIGEYMLE